MEIVKYDINNNDPLNKYTVKKDNEVNNDEQDLKHDMFYLYAEQLLLSNNIVLKDNKDKEDYSNEYMNITRKHVLEDWEQKMGDASRIHKW